MSDTDKTVHLQSWEKGENEPLRSYEGGKILFRLSV